MSYQEKWIKYIRGCVFPQRIEPILCGNAELYSRYFNVPFGEHACYVNEKILDWRLERKWAFRLGHFLIRELSKNSPYAKKFKKNWNDLYNEVRRESDKIIFYISLKKLSNSDLKNIYLKCFDLAERSNALTNISIDVLDEVLIIEKRKELKKIIKDKDKGKFEEFFRILNTPNEATYTQKRDYLILSLIMKMARQGHVTRGKKINFQPYKKEIENIAKQYWWSSLGWMSNPRFTARDVEKEIRDFLAKEKFREKYSQFKNYLRDNKKRKDEALKEIKISKKIKDLLRVFEEVAVWHDQRKETQVKMAEANDEILKEIVARGKELTFADIVWLTHEEALDYLEGEIGFKPLVKKRKAHTFCHITRNDFIWKEGEAARNTRDEVFGSDKKILTVKDFKGFPASLHHAKGRVIVSNDPRFLNKKTKKGEIIVTAQSTPDFVPAMKRAGGVITDEGGATSHAAIISRELNIPCIVGTKIATQVLKTGDLVEIDAAKGLVRILSKKRSDKNY